MKHRSVEVYIEGYVHSHQEYDSPILQQPELYLSGSEPSVPHTLEAYRSALSLHPRARLGWRCQSTMGNRFPNIVIV